MHELRAAHRLLLDQIQECLATLSKSCKVLALNVAESREQRATLHSLDGAGENGWNSQRAVPNRTEKTRAN